MEPYFATMFEDVRHERSLILLLSLTDPDILKLSKFTDVGINIIKNLGPKKNTAKKVSKNNLLYIYWNSIFCLLNE